MVHVICPICGKKVEEAIADEHANNCLERSLTGSGESEKDGSSKSQLGQEDPWAFMRGNKRKSSTSADTKPRLDQKPSKKSRGREEKIGQETEDEKLLRELRRAPLAESMRAKTLEDYVGQDEIVGHDDSSFRSLLTPQNLPSLILWGPPGCGKTTLARVLWRQCQQEGSGRRFLQLSATTSNLNEVKRLVESAKNELRLREVSTILFMDEIHRFNKLQQDVFLSCMESGVITLMGATTENPSFALNSALLSRCRVLALQKLTVADVRRLIDRALAALRVPLQPDDSGTPSRLSIRESAADFLCSFCDGDARIALNGLQIALISALEKKGTEVGLVEVRGALQKNHLLYDRKGDGHFDCISALHKSLRGSDVTASLYWLARMLEAGEDPRYVGRRLIRFASEDVGLADPAALTHTVAAVRAAEMIGMPEADLSLAQAVVYLARAPKSIQVYQAYTQAKDVIKNHRGPQPSVPLHLRNAPTKLLKDIGCAKDYKYNPHYSEPVDQTYLPDELKGLDFLA